jgi:hypothetical protein
MADITPQTYAPTGQALTQVAAAAGGDNFANARGRTMIIVENEHATDSRTVTVVPTTATRPAGEGFPAITVPNISRVVAAGAIEVIGPVPNAYNNASNKVPMTYSNSGNSLKVAAVEV